MYFIEKNLIVDILLENQLFFSIFFTVLTMKAKYFSYKNIYIAGFVHIVGTFFHELSHYLIATITTLNFPRGFSIFPKREGGKIVFGYVEIEKNRLNILNSFLIGMSPLSLLFLAYYFSKYFSELCIMFGFTDELFCFLVYIFVTATLVANSIPSKADFVMSLHKGSFFLYAAFLAFVIFY